MAEKGGQAKRNTANQPGSHPAARGVIKWINKVITRIEAVVLLGLLLFGMYAIWDNQQIDHENTASEYEMYKPTAVDTRTFDDFRKLNPDVCGWLTINDTGIDYPMVHGDDNDEYMNTTADLKFALSGSIFLDYRNKADFSDYNTIIYGHHMEGPSMFGALDQYSEQDFFDSHEDGLIYYGGHWHRLDIFAYLEADAYDEELYGICGSAEEYQTYLDYIKSAAAEYRDAGVGTDDRIVVLSTCMTDKTNGRYIVAGKIGGETTGPAEQTTGRVFSRDGLSPRQINLIFAVIGGLVIFILILLYLWIRYRRRKKMGAVSVKRGADRNAAAVNAADGTDINPQDKERNAVPGTAEEEMKEIGKTGASVKSSGNSSGKNSAGENSGGKKNDEKKNDRKNRGQNARKKKRSVWGDLLDLLIRIAIIAAVIWVVFHYVFGIFVQSGVGMNPSVQDRDIVLFYRLDNEYTANEAVVYEEDGEERLGRIVARGGDTVEITDEGLKVNGYLQQDYKNSGETLAVQGGTAYPVTLASDEFFILGDNREESTDSRMFGPVKLDDVKGSVMTVLRRRDV